MNGNDSILNDRMVSRPLHLAESEAAMAGLPCTTLPRVAVWKPVAFCWTMGRRWVVHGEAIGLGQK